MNYATIKENDIANGEGVCVSLFVSGCPHHCKGCFNPETWDYNYGTPFTQETIDYISDSLTKNEIQRNFSILGGEPLAPQNREAVCDVVQQIRKKFPNIIIYLWTGYLFEDLVLESDRDFFLTKILTNINVLIDGPFVEEKRDLRLKFRGSSNQRIFCLK